MDMERIKQNFRLRSGRTKKSKRFSTATAPAPTPQSDATTETPPYRRQPQRTLSTLDGTDSPSLRNWDRDTALPQIEKEKFQSLQPKAEKKSPSQKATPSAQPNGPNSSKKLMPTEPSRPQSPRYGNSGIERTSMAEEIMPQEKKTQSQPLTKMAKPSPQPKSDSDDTGFDLKPPTSRPKPMSMDTISEMLFSEDHLNILIHDPQLMSRFTGFLNRYKPALSAVILQYLEYQKAIKAIEYANAVAASIGPLPDLSQYGENKGSKSASPPPAAVAAQLSPHFAEISQQAFTTLLNRALPAFITYTLVRLSTECLIAEISNHHATPLTRNLIGGLSEVFCLSDPTLPDNPLIYCSEEFYRLTGYASGDVLGQNCRFLQGAKTDKMCVTRIGDCVERGEAVTETILNYRRDGRGFMNVLMISPLEDDNGKVKYFLGAQIDVSRLVAGGWGLEGLEKLMQKRELDEMKLGRNSHANGPKDNALKKLRELSEMFDLEESAVVQTHSRSSSSTRSEGSDGSDRLRRTRRVFGDDGEEKLDGSSESSEEDETEKEKNTWKLAQTGSSGKLPGVYQSYLLIRPAPSLKIIFVSPALRKLGKIVQNPFLSHLAAPAPTLSGLKESFTAGVPVTAKVALMSQPGKRDGTETGRWRRGKSDGSESNDPQRHGRTCWISATPLLGADDEVGVWMVVLVDKASVPTRMFAKSSQNKFQQPEGHTLKLRSAKEVDNDLGNSAMTSLALSDDIRADDQPIKPTRAGENSLPVTPGETTSRPPSQPQEDREAAKEVYRITSDESKTTTAKPDEADTTKADGDAPESGTNGHNTDDEADDDFLTSRHDSVPGKKKPDHVQTQNDSDDEGEAPRAKDEAATAEHAEKQDAETTPTKLKENPEADGELLEESWSGSRPGTGDSRGPLPMDYLRHPGTRKERVGGTAELNVDSSSDPDCRLYSPYSVD